MPEDISVIGHEGSPIMAFTDPPLTTVEQPVEQLAAAAVRALIEDIENTPRLRRELLFQPELIVRGSTAAASPTLPGCSRRSSAQNQLLTTHPAASRPLAP